MVGTRLTIRVLVFAAIVVIDIAAWGVRATMAPEAGGVIDPAMMRPDGARAWSAPLRIETAWWVRVPNDGLGASRLALVERRNGENDDQVRALGPARAPPDVVRERGAGAFTHWGELLFSTSDGSDPRTNGAVYEWRSPTVLHPRLALLLLIATSAALLWTLSGWFAAAPRARPWVLAGAAALLFAAWNLEAKRLYPGWINVDWDTASYLGWSPERTAGYPLILEVVEWLTIPAGDLRFLLFVQLNAMLASFAWLGLAVDRLLRTRVTGLAVFILLATSPRLIAFPFNVLTESFFVTGTCVLLALLARVAADDRADGAAVGGASDAASASAGEVVARGADAAGGTARPLLRCAAIGAVFALTELVRPAAFGMLGMVLLPVLWRRGARWRTLAAIVAPYAIIMLIASTASWLRFGFFATSSMGPVSLLGHVAWNIRADHAPECPGLAARVEARLAPVLAKRPATMSWPGEYFFVTSDEYNELLWANVMPETEAWVRERQAERDREAREAGAPLLEGPERTRAERRELMRARGALARHALLADPAAYAKHVGAHVWGFWQSAARPAPLGYSLKVRVPRGGESTAQLWPEAKARFAWMGAPPAHDSAETAFDRVTWMERWRLPLDSTPSLFWKLCVAATLAGVVLAPFSRRLTPAGRLLALASVGFQGSAHLVAAVAAVIARYVDAVEPLTVVACVAAVVCIGETITRIRGESSPTSRSPRPLLARRPPAPRAADGR